VTTPAASTASAPALGKAAFRGSFWMIFNALATRVASLLATILLGRWLATSDFAVYGIAMSMTALASVLRDGGVRQYLIKEHKRHDELVGPVFYMALAFNTATGVGLAVLSRFSGLWTDNPLEAAEVAKVLMVIALCQPLNTPGAILQARLMGEMKFGIVSVVTGVSAFVRFGGAIVLAGLFPAPLGALAFVLPLPACALFEWIAFWRHNRERLWTRSPRVGTWPGMFSHSSWILLGSFAIAMVNWGANPALAATSRDFDLVAVYFFAFNIVIQVGILLSANVGQVLVPAFVRLADEPDRLRAAVLKAMRQVVLLAGPLSLGLAVTFPALEQLLWHGKWARAADAVRVMGLLYPFSVALSVPLSLLQARGRFRQWAMGLLLLGAITVGSACAGGVFFKEQPDAATRVAWVTGLLGSAVSLAYAVRVTRAIGAPIGSTLSCVLPAWTIAALSAIPVFYLDDHALASWHPLARFLITGTLFTTAFTLLVRVLLAQHLIECLHAAPARLRPLVRRALLLPEDSP
jgi:O-antigen/teichoic acid export membrane protein